MSAITLDDASELLTKRRIERLLRSLALAQKAWAEKAEPAILSPGTRGSFYHDYFYWHAGLEFARSEGRGFRLGEHDQQRYVAFDDALILRVKHFDRGLAARNARTEHSMMWSTQLSLDGMPPVARLNLGYQLDLTATRFQGLFITLPNGDPISINSWVWQLYGEPATTFGLQRPLNPAGQLYRYDDFSSALAV